MSVGLSFIRFPTELQHGANQVALVLDTDEKWDNITVSQLERKARLARNLRWYESIHCPTTPDFEPDRLRIPGCLPDRFLVPPELKQPFQIFWRVSCCSF